MNSLSWWLHGAWEQSADWWDCKRTRGCWQGQPLVHYSGGQSFTPSWITSEFFSFFPSLRELAKGAGMWSSHSKLDRFHLCFSALWRQKLSRCLWPELYQGCPFCPELPAPQALMWCRTGSSAHFPGENLVFLSMVEMSLDHQPGVHPDSLNCFYSLRRTPQLWPVAGDLH